MNGFEHGNLNKSLIKTLEYSKNARQRICVGISWDAYEEAIEKPDMVDFPRSDEHDIPEEFSNPYGHEIDIEIGKIKEVFDIDLACLIFNKDGELVDAVSPMEGEEIDESGKIYHSGDETDGVSKDDDEIIYVELKDIPEYIHHVFFIAICQSGHDLQRVINPEARVYDSTSRNEMLKCSMGGKDASGKTAFVICRIFRGDDEWMIHHICEHKIDLEIEDWSEELKKYI